MAHVECYPATLQLAFTPGFLAPPDPFNKSVKIGSTASLEAYLVAARPDGFFVAADFVFPRPELSPINASLVSSNPEVGTISTSTVEFTWGRRTVA